MVKIQKFWKGKLLKIILLGIILQLDIKAILRHIFWIYMVACVIFLRLRQRSIERAMDLTDSFTWEDLPTRDAHTGHLTAAGWIARIKIISTRAYIVFNSFHFIQSTFRIVTNHETVITAWYPFDWTVSPFYELVNISQVTISIS
jgi:hypothetical protein